MTRPAVAGSAIGEASDLTHRSVTRQQGSATEAQRSPHDVTGFVLASLAITLTLGAALGVVNLARLTGPWGLSSRNAILAHAYGQVFGFVGLFVMGVACHVVPRFTGATLRSAGSRPILALQTTGVLAIALASLLPATGWPALAAGSTGVVALVGASGLFLTVMRRTIRAAPGCPQGFERWVIAGSVWLLVASCLAGVIVIGRRDIWLHVLWPIGLFGFAGSWIFGVSRRILPMFLGLRPRRPTWERPVWVLYQLGVLGWSIGAWPDGAASAVAARLLGGAALIAAATLFSVLLGFGTRRRVVATDPHRGYERYIMASWAWLGVALATGPLWTLAAVVTGHGESILMLDFSRHTLALGFVSQMIMGVAVRILPVVTGHRLWSTRARSAVFWLLNASVALRGLQAVVAAGYWPAAWPWIALSGPPALLAFSLFSINIAMTLRAPSDAPAGPHIRMMRHVPVADTSPAALPRHPATPR